MSLLTEKFNYKDLKREAIDGKRLYACPDGSKVPSVTTILDKTKPLEKIQALENWRRSVGHERAREITTEAASRGTRMHKYLEDYIKNGYINEPGTNPFSKQSHKMALTVIEEGLKDINEVWGVEINLFYPGIYAGTTDGIGVHLNDEAVLDYKQSNKPKKEEWIEDYYLQLVAYALAHNKIYNTNIKKGVVLMCVKPPEVSPGIWGTPEYQQFVLTPDKFDFWEQKWWDRVEQYYLKN
jgi:genome maintenance exonuclease 1